MFLKLSKSIQTLNEVAIGDRDADLILENCSLINVYSREILPETQIAISQDRIAYVGKDASHTKGKKGMEDKNSPNLQSQQKQQRRLHRFLHAQNVRRNL